MADEIVGKNDILSVFKRLRSLSANKVCFDCGAKNPTWASVTYGVFICMDCSAVHRSLGVHLSFVRSTQLDTNWNWLQLRAMQLGGNGNAVTFFQQHGCTTTDAQQKYNSRAARLYRDKLHQQATAAIRLHGSKLHIETSHTAVPHSPEHKEIDFFQDISDSNPKNSDNAMLSAPTTGKMSQNNNKDYSSFLNDSTQNVAKPEVRQSSLMSRKPAAKKKTLAGRLGGGLGAQKIATDFNDIEKEVQNIENLRIQDKEMEAKLKVEKEDKLEPSVRLAYKDISIRQKETEEKMKQMDPKKAEQMERLGMGFDVQSNVGSVGHSAASEMKLITQENVPTPTKNLDTEFEDEFEIFSFTAGPPKYGDSPFLSHSASDTSSKVSSIQGHNKKSRVPETFPEKEFSRSSKPLPSNSDEAQKKFGNVKSISSDQYFGPSHDLDFERRTNLSRFEACSSISSEDYFGNGNHSMRSPTASFNSPNLYEIKEGVRDGVNKVAGRISNIANGVISSLQRK